MKTFRIGFIYCITNGVNGKRYVGQTLSKNGSRWKGHKCAAKYGAQFPLHRAIRKYGIDKFSVEIIHRCTQPLLNAAEQHYIATLGTLAPNGYNLTTGGGQYKVTARTRRLHSLSMKGREFSEESRRRMSEAQKKRFRSNPVVWSDTARRKLSARNKGKRPSQACMDAALCANRGVKRGPLSPEHKAAISRGNKAKWATRNAAEKHAIIMRGVEARTYAERCASARRGVINRVARQRKEVLV